MRQLYIFFNSCVYASPLPIRYYSVFIVTVLLLQEFAKCGRRVEEEGMQDLRSRRRRRKRRRWAGREGEKDTFQAPIVTFQCSVISPVFLGDSAAPAYGSAALNVKKKGKGMKKDNESRYLSVFLSG